MDQAGENKYSIVRVACTSLRIGRFDAYLPVVGVDSHSVLYDSAVAHIPTHATWRHFELFPIG